MFKIDEILGELEKEYQIKLIVNMFKNGMTITDDEGYMYRSNIGKKSNCPCEIIEPNETEGAFWSYEIAAKEIIERVEQ